MSSSVDAEPDSEPAPIELTPKPIVVEAIYEDGVIKPLVPLDLPSGTPISLHIAQPINAVVVPQASPDHTGAEQRPAAPTAAPHEGRLGHIASWLAQGITSTGLLAGFTRLDIALMAFGLLVYSLTRFIGLERFPIYFFSDEAIQATLADQLLQRTFRDSSGVFLPPYFQNADKWSLSLSIYIQLLGVALFGKSVVVTRATSVAVSILGAAAVVLTLKLIFKNRLWWSGALVLAILPTWFLHSRTAFETVMMVSFYACFLCTYLLYRYHSPSYLVPALVFGAATFYSYANGQGVMFVSAILLLLSDLRYHLRQPRSILVRALVTGLLLAVPYIRFRYLHAEAIEGQLRTLDSYWLHNFPLSRKLATFGQIYLQGLSPGYWFVPNQVDLDRHQMKGMGHLSLLALPFFLAGLGVCLLRWRSSAHRAVLIALLAAPFSAALAAILIPRVLALVIPATLLICIGLDQIADWARGRVPATALAIGCGALLCLLSFSITRTALVDGPTWYTDYGLYGTQYGAPQVFSAIGEELGRSPGTRIVLSPSWANNTDVFGQFFLPEAQRSRVSLMSVDAVLQRKRELSPDQLFILPSYEYDRASTSNKLVVQQPQRIIPYPDGRPGFYFVHMQYVDNVEAIFAAEHEARQQLDETTITLDGQNIQMRHSKLDMDQVAHLFDSDTQTLIRGLEANPLVLEFIFPTTRSISGLRLHTARMNLALKIELTPANGAAPLNFTSTYRDTLDEPQIDYALPDGPQQVSKLRIEITELNPGEEVHVHVRELAFY